MFAWQVISLTIVVPLYSEEISTTIDEVYITVDVANVREKPDKNAKILFRLPYGIKTFGKFIDSSWFKIEEIKNGEQNKQPASGYAHITTLSADLPISQYFSEPVDTFAKRKGLKGQEYLKILELAHSLHPIDTVISRKLSQLYNENKNHVKAAYMDSITMGLNPILIAAPLLDGSIAVLGKLFPSGDFEKMTFENTNYGNTEWQETLRIQMSSIKWVPVGKCLNSNESFIYPSLSYGTFGGNEMGSRTEWIQLTKPGQRIYDIYKVSLNPDFIFISQKCSILETASLLQKFSILDNQNRLDSLYFWLYPQPCPEQLADKRLLKTLTVLSITGTPFIDLDFRFTGQCQEMSRVIVDTAFNKVYVGSGNAGLWLCPANWKNDIKFTLAPHSNSQEECEPKYISIWIDIIVILNGTTIIKHEVSLGSWG
jgi:hypothetical protein